MRENNAADRNDKLERSIVMEQRHKRLRDPD